MSEAGLERDNSMQEDEIEVADLENNDSGNTNDDRAKLNSSSTSLDKYVGKGRNSKYMTLLPEDFEPGDMDVLCGRGKRCFNSLVSYLLELMAVAVLKKGSRVCILPFPGDVLTK